MKYICVFCGSSSGFSNGYSENARRLGQILVSEKYHLVYGGGSVGLMGILADTVLSKGGQVTGVIPHFLVEKEVDHKGITKMITVNSMHERKQKMAELSDAFIAMPGGFGTFEELFEVLTWSQLGLLEKPIGLLNVDGFYDSLVSMLNTMVSGGFLKIENREMLITDESPAGLIDKMKNFKPVHVQKWLGKEQT